VLFDSDLDARLMNELGLAAGTTSSTGMFNFDLEGNLDGFLNDFSLYGDAGGFSYLHS
jgi:hypothetical protein